MNGPMMRSRQRGNPCRVQGHGCACEVSESRALRQRAQDKREWRQQAVVEWTDTFGGDHTMRWDEDRQRYVGDLPIAT